MFSEFNVSQRSKKTNLNDDLDNKLTFIRYEFFEEYAHPVEFKYHREIYDVTNPIHHNFIIPEIGMLGKKNNELVNYYSYYSIEIRKENDLPQLKYIEMYDTIRFLLKCSSINIIKIYDLLHRNINGNILIPISYIQEIVPTPDELNRYRQEQQRHSLSKMVLNNKIELSEIITDYIW